jgi:hypothetical protein
VFPVFSSSAGSAVSSYFSFRVRTGNEGNSYALNIQRSFLLKHRNESILKYLFAMKWKWNDLGEEKKKEKVKKK